MVGVDHHDHVGAVKHRAAVTALLVGAVAPVGWVAEHFKAFSERYGDGVVTARVVNQQRAVERFNRQVGGDPFNRLRRVVGGQNDVDFVITAALSSQTRLRFLNLLVDRQHYALVTERERQ